MEVHLILIIIIIIIVIIILLIIKVFIEMYSQADVGGVQFNTSKNKIKLYKALNVKHKQQNFKPN